MTLTETERGNRRPRENYASAATNRPDSDRMISLVNDYLSELIDRFGQAWNRFWFAPSDALTLSIIRVLTGLVAFYTVLTYTPDLIVLFGPDGILSESLRSLPGGGLRLSYLYYLHSPTSLWIAHIAGLAILAAFTAGLMTRITSVLSLVVVLAYIQRSFVLTSEMEPVLAFVMVYLCLGPAGSYLSIDRWLARRKGDNSVPAESWPTTVATRLIQVHLWIVYVMMLLAQLNENAWWDGTAIWWLAGRRESSLVDLTWLHQYPMLVNAWTHGFVLFEGLFIALAWNRLAAPLLVALGLIAWGLMALVTGLVPLAVIMVVASLAFIQPGSLKKLLDSLGLSNAAN